MRQPARTRPPTMRALVACVAVALGASACQSSTPSGSASSGSTTGTTPAPADTTWLCRPGLANNPCATSLDYTTVAADGSTKVTTVAPAPAPAVDCFYVYPTVSQQQTENADLTIEPAETNVATEQAARFSPLCNVWAPMYKQGTLKALAQANGSAMSPQVMDTAYQSLLSGWRDYLAHHNEGRPIVFLAHSQGSALTLRLLADVVEPDAALLRRVVGAVIPGGNAEVPTVVGGSGSFRQLHACRSSGQTGCVIAYSTYPGEPPADSVFGRPGKGVSTGEPGNPATTQVVCVNPASLGGGTAALDSFFTVQQSPTPGVTVTTPWVEYPGRYQATCRTAGDATWLQVDTAPGDSRPVVAAKAPQIGYHSDDINLALGNLVPEVQSQVAAFQAANR